MTHRLVCAALACAAGLASHDAAALMAGRAPDTPAARVDANLPSSPWTSAVAVVVNGSTYSGVVVAPRYVLTAAHVVGAALPANVSVRLNAQATTVTLAVSAIARFPSYSFPYDDLALLSLDGDVPSEVQIPRLYQQAVGGPLTITLVGYGASGQGDVGPSVASSASVKRSGGNRVDAVQGTVDASGRTSSFYLFDFDGPSGNGSYGGATLGNAVETGLASGDSGSPAYIQVDGQPWLLGINTLAAAPPGGTGVDYRFGTIGGGMLLGDSRFVDWLTAQSQGTLGPPALHADVPLPAWALAMLAAVMLPALTARRTLRHG